MTGMRAVTLITGASAGIGVELARVFAKNGHELVLIARRADRLEKLADEIAATGRVRPTVLPLDLTASDAVKRIGDALAAQGLEPEYIVNNAGYGLVGQAAKIDRAEQLGMIDLNVRLLTDLSLAFVDALERRRGGILNVASLAGFLPGPGMTVYYATKAYVVSFSEALSAELGLRNIRVTVLCPGPVRTEFQRRAGVTTESYSPTLTLPADVIAEDGYRALMAGKRVAIPGWRGRLLVSVMRVVPRSVLIASSMRRQAKRLKSQPGA